MDTPPTNSPGPGAAAAAAVAPDAITAEILRKHAANEPLTPQESGKLGWWKKQLNRITGGPAEPAGAAPPPGKPAGMAPVAPGEAPADSLAPVLFERALCERTASALLSRADAFTVQWIEREAKSAAAGLDPADRDKIVNRFRTAAALPAPDKKLLIEISPEVFQELGWDPKKFALYTAIGVLGLHTVNIWQAVGELREMRRENHKKTVDVESEVKPAPASAAPVTPGVMPPTFTDARSSQSIPVPARPKGAPPEVT